MAALLPSLTISVARWPRHAGRTQCHSCANSPTCRRSIRSMSQHSLATSSRGIRCVHSRCACEEAVGATEYRCDRQNPPYCIKSPPVNREPEIKCPSSVERLASTAADEPLIDQPTARLRRPTLQALRPFPPRPLESPAASLRS
jgi:hypothetical protein